MRVSTQHCHPWEGAKAEPHGLLLLPNTFPPDHLRHCACQGSSGELCRSSALPQPLPCASLSLKAFEMIASYINAKHTYTWKIKGHLKKHILCWGMNNSEAGISFLIFQWDMEVLLLNESTGDMYPPMISIRHTSHRSLCHFVANLSWSMSTHLCFTINLPAKVESRCFTLAWLSKTVRYVHTWYRFSSFW